MRTKLLLFLFFVTYTTFSQVVNLGYERGDFVFNDWKSVQFFLEQDGFVLEDLSPENFRPLEEREGFNEGVYWYQMEVYNPSSQPRATVFSVRINGIHKDKLYYKEAGNLLNSQQISHGRYDGYYVPVSPKGKVYIYVRVEHKTSNSFGYLYSDIKPFIANVEDEYLVTGVHYGLSGMILLFFVIIYFIFKDVIFLKLFGFYFSYFGMHLAHDGFFISLFENVYVSSGIDAMIHFSLLVFTIAFSNDFLKSNLYFSFDRILSKVCIIAAGILYMIFILSHQFVYMVAADFVMMFVISVYTIQSLILYKKMISARLYFSGILILFIAGWFSLVPFNLGYPELFFSYNTVKYALVLTGLFMLVGIVYNFREATFKSVQSNRRIENFNRIIKKLQNELAETKLEEKDRYAELKKNVYHQAEKRGLSRREQDVVWLVCKGYSNLEISEKLYVSVNTVKYHLKNIFIKEEVDQRKDLVKIYLHQKHPTH
ncbi:MAG: LuxR C-terminal-related transcriptional regulator [Flavobacteriaceae bacterium]